MVWFNPIKAVCIAPKCFNCMQYDSHTVGDEINNRCLLGNSGLPSAGEGCHDFDNVLDYAEKAKQE